MTTQDTMQTLHISLSDEWDRCQHWIEAALPYASNSHRINDVWLAIQNGKAQFFPRQKCAIVTEIVDYPRRSVCRIWLAGGDLDELIDAEKDIAQWARSIGCSGMEIIGRKGWQRKLTDYQPKSTVFVREL